MDHSAAEVREHPGFGKGVYALSPIAAGEVVAEFDGEVYYGLINSDFPDDVINHLISFGPDRARNSAGIAKFLNHSCEPNVGVKGLFSLVAMRDIDAGEELCWDYDMSEDSDWELECGCGSENCRKRIGGFRFLPPETRRKYAGFISDWLVEKYELE